MKEILKRSGLSSFDGSAFWAWHFGTRDGVYDAIGFDRMHVVKGLVENVMNALDWVIGSESPQRKKKAVVTYVAAKHALLDARFAKLPAFMGGQSVYIPSLTGGFYAKKRVEVSSIVCVNLAMIINIVIGMASERLAITYSLCSW